MKTLPGTKLNLENIFCIGRNYAEHARELGNPIPVEPVVFMKPTSSICFSGDSLVLPPQSKRVDHEVEIVVAISEKVRDFQNGKNLTEDQALHVIEGIAIGIDFTARDIQDKAKEKGLPWTVCKGFDGFAAVSSFAPSPTTAQELSDLRFSLDINGVPRQSGHSAEMLNSIPRLIAYLSSIFRLSPGDIIFTGTPKGVTPIQAGDQLTAKLGDIAELTIQVASSSA